MNHRKTNWAERENEDTKMRTTCLTILLGLFCFSACSPTVKVAAPDEPITINLNVKIEHAIKVQVEKDLDDVLNTESGLF